MTANKSTCQYCGAPVRWVKTGNGSRIPMDTKPIKGMWFEFMGTYVKGDGYTSHFATCEKLEEVRERR